MQKKKADEVPLVTIDGGWKRNNLKEGLTVEEVNYIQSNI